MVNEPGGAIMDIADLFAQADVFTGSRKSNSLVDVMNIQTTKSSQGPSKYRKKFQESLDKKRTDKTTDSKSRQKLESRSRENLSSNRNSSSATENRSRFADVDSSSSKSRFRQVHLQMDHLLIVNGISKGMKVV